MHKKSLKCQEVREPMWRLNQDESRTYQAT